MKKIIFTLSGLLLLTLTSCEKENIKPIPKKDSIERRSFIDDSDNTTKSSVDSREFEDYRNASDSIFNITDPNRDEDEDRKVKGKS